MSQYLAGTANVTNGSATVTGTNTLWLANVTASDSFTVAGDGVMYDVASVDSDTQITLSVAYAGVTASGVVYAIGTGFTVPDSFPEMSQGDIETATIFTRAMRKIQGKFSAIVSDISGKADQATTYTETEVDSLLDDKAAIAGQVFTGEIIYNGAGGNATNTSYGPSALSSNVNGVKVVAIGRSALRYSTTAESGTSVGNYSLGDVTEGSNNTAVGSESGRGITTGSGNSIFGAEVGGLASDLENNLILASGGVIRLQHDGVNTTTLQGDLVADKITASTGILFGTDTAAANTLDDYETGTWLPGIGGNTTYTRQIGNYTKIGKLVTLSGEIDVNVLGPGSTFNITGLPFTNSNIQGTGSINFFTDLAVSPVSLVLHIPYNDSRMITYGLTAASATMSPIDIFGDNARIIFTAIYLT